MFAVKFRKRDSEEWSYINNSVIVSESEIVTRNYSPNLYLCNNLSEASKVYKIAISRFRDSLKYIKISEMNKYSDYRTEFQVLSNYWREW